MATKTIRTNEQPTYRVEILGGPVDVARCEQARIAIVAMMRDMVCRTQKAASK